MNKKWLTAVIACSICFSSMAQTLFTFGGQAVETKDFLRAYNKNNSQEVADRSKAMREYLQLYINSRLKIREAYERGYDKLPQIRAEVDNLRGQIIDHYLTDPGAIDRLTREAFTRSQKDIHAGHLFISIKNNAGIIDTMAAREKLDEAMKKLAKGEKFSSVVKEYSDEPGAKESGGDMGWITVFTLPYEFENVVYATTVGKNSKPYRSKIGYHVFRNMEERKALGKLKAAQILLAFPPEADEKQKAAIGRLADSIYLRLKKGDDFGRLASQFSNDYVSAANGGVVPDIAIGQFDPEFERLAWSLAKDGEISKPYLSSHGYHIIKRIARKPVVTDPNNAENLDELKRRITADDRWKTARDFIYDRVKSQAGFSWKPFQEEALWAFSDSVLNMKPSGIGRSITMDMPLFKIGDTTINVMQWIAYAQAFRYRPDRTGFKAWPELMDEFTKTAMFEYYRNNLEEFNEEFARQMAEFRDGNLFFEIMQQEIWNKAQSDTAGLKQLYDRQPEHYAWKPSADAIFFFSTDAATAKEARAAIKKDPSSWRNFSEKFSEKLVTDSSRYEWSVIPGLKGNPKAGAITEDLVNPADNSVSFAYIIRVYNNTAPRSFTEAKGMVMNDYQNELEEQWLKRLREKYPVTINEKELKKLTN